MSGLELRASATGNAPPALGHYSQAMIAGDLVFCSGQMALDPVTGQVVGGDAGLQAKVALDNLAAVLEASGSSLDRVIKTTIFLVDLADFGRVNDEYAAQFGDHRPARVTVEVRGLPRGARVQIECVALIAPRT
jgi:2-iminobutanoate/2-iminopropanoate deaminase